MITPMYAEQTSAFALMEQVACLIDKACDSGDTVSAIAKRSGIERVRVSNIRNRHTKTPPKIDTIQAIAEALGYRIDFVLRED